MEQYIEILSLAEQNKLPNRIDDSTNIPLHIFKELVDAGYINAIVSKTLNPKELGFLDAKITSRGRTYLHELKERAKTKQAQQTIRKTVTNKSRDWHNKPWGKIIIGLIVGIILYIIALIFNHFYLTHQKPPHLVLRPVKYEEVPYLQYKKEGNKITLVVQMNIKNIGETTATQITYSNTSIKCKILGQNYVNNLGRPPGVPLSLPPEQDYFYQQNIKIINLTAEQIEKLIRELKKEDFFVISDVTVNYSNPKMSEQHTVSARYKITAETSIKLKYTEK